MKRINFPHFILLSLLLHVVCIILFLLFGSYKFFAPPRPPKSVQPDFSTVLIPLQHNPAPSSSLMPPQQPAVQSEPNEHHAATESLPDQVADAGEPAKHEARAEKIEQARKPQRKNIFSMTNDFLSAQRQQGNSLMEFQGNTKNPSLEELKYLSYQQKVDAAIMNSWRMVRKQQLRTAQTHVERPVSFRYEINKDGSLLYLQLVNSSGDTLFDELVLLAIRQAAPFPPIPEHLGIATYRPINGMYRVSW